MGTSRSIPRILQRNTLRISSTPASCLPMRKQRPGARTWSRPSPKLKSLRSNAGPCWRLPTKGIKLRCWGSVGNFPLPERPKNDLNGFFARVSLLSLKERSVLNCQKVFALKLYSTDMCIIKTVLLWVGERGSPGRLFFLFCDCFFSVCYVLNWNLIRKLIR